MDSMTIIYNMTTAIFLRMSLVLKRKTENSDGNEKAELWGFFFMHRFISFNQGSTNFL